MTAADRMFSDVASLRKFLDGLDLSSPQKTFYLGLLNVLSNYAHDTRKAERHEAERNTE